MYQLFGKIVVFLFGTLLRTRERINGVSDEEIQERILLALKYEKMTIDKLKMEVEKGYFYTTLSQEYMALLVYELVRIEYVEEVRSNEGTYFQLTEKRRNEQLFAF